MTPRQRTTPAVVVVGAATRDIDANDSRGWRLGGGVTHCARALAGLGLTTGVVMGIEDAAADAHELDELRGQGVLIHRVRLDQGPVFENRESHGARIQIAHQPSDQMPADAIPTEWRETCAMLLTPVAGELGAGWADAAPPDAIVAIDLQGLARVLVADREVRPRRLTRTALTERADLISVSAEDLRGGPVSIADLLVHAGQQLALTRAERGSVHIRRRDGGIDARRIPAVRSRRLVSAVGAGDTFVAAWLAATLMLRTFHDSDPDGWRALHLASLASSLVVERTPISRAAIRRHLAGESLL
ncbi:MAG: PfkB family carbohydrate kinase [Candidatus Limnocylindrales bacterium]